MKISNIRVKLPNISKEAVILCPTCGHINYENISYLFPDRTPMFEGEKEMRCHYCKALLIFHWDNTSQ